MKAMIAIVTGSIAMMTAAGSVEASAPLPDFVLLNARVRTMDPVRPTAEAMGVQENRIVAIGSSAEIRRLRGPDTRVIDAGGRLVLPGFNDAHVHFLMGGFALSSVDLRDAATPAELARRLGAFAQKLPKGQWIRGGRWDHEQWPGAPLPTKELIDPVTPDHPVFVSRTDGHMVLANSLALRLAGVTKETKDPPGGVIVRDKAGEPTGVLKDAAEDLVAHVMPPRSREEKHAAALAATEHAAALGVTSVTDVSADDDVALYREMERCGELRTRIYAARSILSWRTLGEEMMREGLPAAERARKDSRTSEAERARTDSRTSDSRTSGRTSGGMVRIGGVKGFADGSLGSSTALFFEPYADAPDTRGLLFDQMLPEGAMLERVLGADRAGIQVMIHAIGDEANLRILDIYAEVVTRNGERDRRLRIEHAQHLRPSEIARFGREKVIASMQPYHLADDGRWCEKRIGAARSKGAYAFRSLLKAGAVLAFGSDWYVAPLNPLEGIKAAVTRQTLDGKHPGGWIPEEKISVDEAVRGYTVGAAYAEFAEAEKGTIAPGKLADLVVLDRDIYEIDPAEIDSVRVTMTITGGRVVYDAADNLRK